MSELNDLYQEVILDHNRRPRNFSTVPDANRSAEGYNPLCGDRITVTLRMNGDRIEEIGFQGAGCAISTASASLMTEAVKGKREAEIDQIFREFHLLATGDGGRQGSQIERLGSLAVFGGISQYPVRVKCATLAWHTLKAALENRPEPVSTE